MDQFHINVQADSNEVEWKVQTESNRAVNIFLEYRGPGFVHRLAEPSRRVYWNAAHSHTGCCEYSGDGVYVISLEPYQNMLVTVDVTVTLPEESDCEMVKLTANEFRGEREGWWGRRREGRRVISFEHADFSSTQGLKLPYGETVTVPEVLISRLSLNCTEEWLEWLSEPG